MGRTGEKEGLTASPRGGSNMHAEANESRFHQNIKVPWWPTAVFFLIAFGPYVADPGQRAETTSVAIVPSSCSLPFA